MKWIKKRSKMLKKVKVRALSFDEDNTAASFSPKSLTLVTFDVCSLRCEIISLDLISHTLTSPSKPPEQKNLRFLLRQMLYTPPLCALSIYQIILPFSLENILIFPSCHPLSTISSLYVKHRGDPALFAKHLVVTT